VRKIIAIVTFAIPLTVCVHACAAGWAFFGSAMEPGCRPIIMRGEIVKGDSQVLLELMAKNTGCRHYTPMINFDSRGGDVYEAIKIGRLIREKQYGSAVPFDFVPWIPDGVFRCVSSCNLAFIGGVVRSVDGAFGIHRPYSDTLNLDNASASERYESIVRMLHAYVSDMRVSADLVEQMMRISPQDVRFLTGSEMAAMGITGNDPIWEDMKASQRAAQLGITKSEFIRRRALTNQLCAEGDRQCSDRIMNSGQ
jgi:hypothetical protein